MAVRQKLRILCFGDSLTAGYSSFGAVFHPYHQKLQQMIEMAFPDMDVEIVEDGRSGDLVKYGFLPRMQENYQRARKNGESYNWTIVLGGTNDLGYSIKPDEIFDKLKEIWDIPLRRKSKLLALTVPEAGVEAGRQRLDARRTRLNDLIKGYKREGFHVFDLAAAVPYFDMTVSDRERYWDDAIHFTPDGYDLIGKEVGMGLVKILEKERADNPPPPAKRRRVFKDDEKTFEEEDGDPNYLEQGYIVVRRRDLD